MDILNFISWIKGKRQVTTVDANKTLLPVGIKDPKRDDEYIAGAITVSDFADSLNLGPVVDAEGNLIVANSSADTVAVGPGGSHLIPDFSGMLIVNDHFDGGVETWIAGGGDTICLGATNTGGGPVGSILQISGTGYEWINDSNMTGPFTFTVIKTRNEA